MRSRLILLSGVVVLCGAVYGYGVFKSSAALRQQIPAAEFMAVDSAGHLPHIEQAGLVTARLISFFESH